MVYKLAIEWTDTEVISCIVWCRDKLEDDFNQITLAVVLDSVSWKVDGFSAHCTQVILRCNTSTESIILMSWSNVTFPNNFSSQVFV